MTNPENPNSRPGSPNFGPAGPFPRAADPSAAPTVITPTPPRQQFVGAVSQPQWNPGIRENPQWQNQQSGYGAAQSAAFQSPPSAGMAGAYPAPATRVSAAVPVIAAIIAAAGALTVVAAFLPWITGPISIRGLGDSEVGATDGVITLVLGVITLALGVTSAVIRKRSALHLVAGIAALVAGLGIVLIAVIDISGVSDLDYVGFRAGIGLWLTLLCGVALVAAGIAGIIKRS